jgi:lysophospholipase L1-like esterase
MQRPFVPYRFKRRSEEGLSFGQSLRLQNGGFGLPDLVSISSYKDRAVRNVKFSALGYLILLVAMAGCGVAPFHISTPPKQETAVACWGDSLTQGNQDLTGVSYPGVLPQLLGFTVYNEGIDGQTSTQIAARMLAATNMYGDTDVFWAGRDDYKQGSYPESQVLSNIASMVNALASSPKRYLILSVPNGDGIWDLKGTQDYNRIMALNSALAAAYPNNYFDIRSYLVSQYDPTNLLDVFDHENDVWPASLRAHNLTGSLAAPIGDSDTTVYMNVTSAVHPIISNILEVDSEYMCITEVTAPTSPAGVYSLTVLRGYANSPVSSHQANLAIVGIDPLHLNATGYTKVAQQVANWLNSH